MQTQANEQDLSRLRTLHKASVVVAIVLFLVLAVAFSLKWEAVYQVVAGLGAFAAIEWQRRIDRRIKELGKDGSGQGAAKTA